MEAHFPHLFLVRISGDLGTKARWTHARFARRLGENLRDALAAEGIPGRVRRTPKAIYRALDRIHTILLDCVRQRLKAEDSR